MNNKIRDLLSIEKLSFLAGAHDALSAKIASKCGFDGIWASGLGISATYCVPDMSILTMSEFLNSADAMASCTDIPVICDCDAGFGNMHNVMATVKKYEKAGIAGICIEDKKHPKLNSFINKSQACEDIEEFCAKLRAACYTKKSKDFILIARCESLIAGLGIEEALFRSKKYADSGADAILIHSRQKTPEEILEFIKRWEKYIPLIIIPTTYPDLKIDHSLAQMGVSTIIFANQALRASVKAIEDTLTEIHKNKSSKLLEDKISSVNEIFKLQGMDEINHLENKFYGGAHE